MKQYVLAFLISCSLFVAPVAAQDIPQFDLPAEFKELMKGGEIDPQKFQEAYARLTPEQQQQFMQMIEEEMSKLSPEERNQIMSEAQEKMGHEGSSKLTESYRTLKQKVTDQIGQISFLLQDLGQQVTSNKKLQIPNKQEVEIKLAKLSAEVEELKSMAIATGLLNDPETLYKAILITDELLRCIDQAVINKLTAIPDLNTEVITTRKIALEDIEEAKLQAHVERNEKRLTAIHKLTNNMGTSWFNRSYKAVTSKINPYNIFLGSVAVGIATYYMYRFSNESFGAYDNGTIPVDENWFQKVARVTGLSWYKKTVPGEKPRIGEALLEKIELDGSKVPYRDPNYVINQNNVTKFGTSVAKLEELGIFSAATTPLFTLGGMCMLFQEKALEGVKKLRNTALKAHAYLQGKEEYKSIDEFGREPRFTLSDVEGHEHIKQEMSILPAYFRDPEKMDRTGKSPGRFWMLHGNSRTGKSMLGEALAGEVKLALRASGSSQKFTYMPITAEMLMLVGIETIINYANNIKPCIICIDEFDLSGAQRERNSKLLAETLNAMGNAQLNDEVGNQVYFIFICNHIEHNDFALINRMDHIIEVNLPTYNDRKAFLIKELNKQFILVSPEFVDKMAHESEGKTIEELKRAITLAKQESFTSHQPVDELSLQKAFYQQIHKVIFAGLPFDAEQIKQLAAFQAGKTLVTREVAKHLNISLATTYGISKKIHEVSMYSNATLGERKQKPKDWTKYGQVFTYRAHDALQLNTNTELERAIKMKLAGHIAQELMCGSQSTNYRKNAKNKAYQLANKIVFAGVDEAVLPKEVKNEMKKKTHELVVRCEQEVRALLTEQKDKLDLLTKALSQYKILSGEDINFLLTDKPAPAPEAPAPAPNEAVVAAA